MCPVPLVTPGNGTEAAGASRTGLLIIRAWIEEGSSEPLRAELRISSDVSAGFDRTLTLSRTQEVCATVGEWLGEVLSDPEGSQATEGAHRPTLAREPADRGRPNST